MAASIVWFLQSTGRRFRLTVVERERGGKVCGRAVPCPFCGGWGGLMINAGRRSKDALHGDGAGRAGVATRS